MTLGCCEIGPIRSALSRLSESGGGGGENVGELVKPPASSWAFTAYAPNVSSEVSLSIPNIPWDWTDYAPDVSISALVTVPAAAYIWTGYAPAVSTEAAISIPAAAWVWTGYAPTIEATAVAAVTLVYVNTLSAVATSISNSFNIGAAPGVGVTRTVVVVAGSTNNNPVVSNIIIDGNSTAPIVSAGAGTMGVLAIAARSVPTGTSITISHNFGGNQHVHAVFVLYGAAALTSTSDNTNSSGVIDVSLNTAAGGALVAAAIQQNGGLVTFVGATEQADVDINAGGLEIFSVGAIATATAQTPRTVTITSSDTTPGTMCGLSASWEPE